MQNGGFVSTRRSTQRGLITIPAGSTTGTATVSAVNVSKSNVENLGFGVGNSVQVGAAFSYLVLTNSTTVTATRNYSDATYPVVVSFELVEVY